MCFCQPLTFRLSLERLVTDHRIHKILSVLFSLMVFKLLKQYVHVCMYKLSGMDRQLCLQTVNVCYI